MGNQKDSSSSSNKNGIDNGAFCLELSSEEIAPELDLEKEESSHKKSYLNPTMLIKQASSGSHYYGGESKNSKELVEDVSHDAQLHAKLSPPLNKVNFPMQKHKSVSGSFANQDYLSKKCSSMFDKEKAASAARHFASRNVGQNLSDITIYTLNDSKPESAPPKEYFQNFRLSLDTPKSISNDLSVHAINHELDCCSEIKHSQDKSGNSYCYNCRKKFCDNYQSALKFMLERPLFCFSLWAILYIFWGKEALPGGSLFAISVLEVTALFMGFVTEFFQLPGLLGMTFAGLVLQNVPYIDVAKDIDFTLSSSLRGTSIVILLIRGGFSVDPVNIVKFKEIVPSLVIGSCVLEAVSVSVAVYFIIGFPLEWAALMGCICSAMSGVAVLPYISMTEKILSGKAEQQPCSTNQLKAMTVGKTACGLDAILAICMAEVALGFIFAEGSSISSGITKGVLEVLIGGAFGIIWGILAGFLLDNNSSNEKRVATVLACGIMSLIGLTKVGYPRGGPLATFLGAFIANALWKKNGIEEQKLSQLYESFTVIWFLFQPLLFAIIGSRIDFKVLDWDLLTKGLICVCIGLIVRFIASFFLTGWGNLRNRERIYLSFTWLIKGTVQAALGPVALETTLSLDDLKSSTSYNHLSNQVMHLSVATIIIAATLGSLSVNLLGPRLLCRKK